MKYICILLMILLFGCSSTSQNQSFELELKGVFDSYESLTNTYRKQLCNDASQYEGNIKLSQDQIQKIIREARNINFFELPEFIYYQDQFVNEVSGDTEIIEVCAPCPTTSLYLKVADKRHTVSWSCNCANNENSSPMILKALLNSVNNPIRTSNSYIQAPESFCVLR